MEPHPVPSIIHTSPTTKKKKSKKEKKRKHADESTPSPDINGSKNISSSSSKKKKKKDKKKQKKEQVKAESIEKSGSPSEHQEQEGEIEKAAPSSSQQISQPSTNTRSETETPTHGSIFSLVARSSSSADSSSALKKSPYQIKTILGTVALLPSSLPDVRKHIQSLLHSLLLMYDSNMGGVLLSLEEGVKLLPVVPNQGNNATARAVGSKRGGLVGGRVVDDLPYIHYRFQVKGLLFCPVVGMTLKGQVMECTPTFVTLTTHHILSTKISTEKLHERGFVYDSKTLAWGRERDVGGGDVRGGEDGEGDVVLGPSTSIYLDDCVEFVVERIHQCGGYISLDGTRPSVSLLPKKE